MKQLPPLNKLFPFTYQGGGYFRKHNVKKGGKSDIIHGEEAIKYLYDSINTHLNKEK